jgi:hypothetical protein
MNRALPLGLILTVLSACGEASLPGAPDAAGPSDTPDAAGPGGSTYQPDAGQPSAETKFAVNTSHFEEAAPVVGAESTYQVVARLASPGGKRQILLIHGDTEEEVAPGGWNLPPVGVQALSAGPDQNAILVCWNTLTGAEPAADRMPQPRHGMSLLCRYRPHGGSFGPTLNVGFDNPNWLRSVAVDTQGSFSVEILRDAAGTFFGKVTAGDGLYSVRLSGGHPEPAILIKAR